MSSFLGKILGNRYILLEKVGEGGMALVYKARCQLLNRYVAVKILRPEYTMDEEFVRKFKRESLAAASLSHPNIVSVYDVGEQDGIYYIVMEFIQGQTLKEYIKKSVKINYNETLNIIYQICLALEHAHKNGIVHRDIKPHNILITEDKMIKVTDFGIARASSSITMTNTNNVMGSVHYFSPEQARGGYSDHRTDIYSLGVVMYEMLTGSLPYDAESPITVALKHIQDSVKEPQLTDPSIPKAVNDIVVKCMEKDMTKRYQSARELINDIQKAQSNPNMSLYDTKVDEQSTRIIPIEAINKANEKSINSKKRGKMAAAVIIGILTTAVIIAAIAWGYNKYFIVKDVKVPEIIGQTEEAAKAILEKNKLIMEIGGNTSSDKPEGQIFKVIPEEGSTVKENSTIRVFISTGQKKAIVPDLKNFDIMTAESLLSKNGLKRGKIDRVNSSDVQKDLIIEQTPAKDTEVTEGTPVDIVISDGPEVKLVPVPVLFGETLDNAKKKLKDANLDIGDVTTGSDSKYVDGVVISQGVQSGTQVKQGSKINITINKLEPEITVTPTVNP